MKPGCPLSWLAWSLPKWQSHGSTDLRHQTPWRSHNGHTVCKARDTIEDCPMHKVSEMEWHISLAALCINWVMSMDTLNYRGRGMQRRHGLNAPGLTWGHAALVALINRIEKPGGLVLETLATLCVPPMCLAAATGKNKLTIQSNITIMNIIFDHDKWAATWNFQLFGMCDQQSLRSACA